MATICCEEVRDTNYCPVCGAKLRVVNPLVSLLAHCRRSQNAAELRAAGKDQSGRGEGGRAAQAGKRWKEWADELAKILEKTSSS